MKADKLKVGDKVRLREGSEAMTVVSIPDHIVYCRWEREGKQIDGAFDFADLEPIADHQNPPNTNR
jgi:uncharacterized protein YodC (DUF2158 family)